MKTGRILKIKLMSRVMSKPDFSKCENEAADQLRGDHAADAADQRLCFRYIDTCSLITLLS